MCLLLEKLEKIQPAPLSEYIRLCLYDKDAGYYTVGTPLGRDFTTSPEISPFFGKTLGFYISNLIAKQLKSKEEQFDQIRIIEVGGGSGKLLLNLGNQLFESLNVSQCWSSQPEKIKIDFHMVEISHSMIELQKETLKGFDVTWNKNLEEVKILEDQNKKYLTFIIANELFDAFPIDQYRLKDFLYYDKNPLVWEKLMVKVKDSRVVFSWQECKQTEADLVQEKIQMSRQSLKKEMSSNLANDIASNYIGDHLFKGFIFEDNIGSASMIKDMANLLSIKGSRAMIIDYGYWDIGGVDTLQGMVQGKSCEVNSSNLGRFDITSHVNFAYLGYLWEKQGLTIKELKSQRQFLSEAGIRELIKDQMVKDGSNANMLLQKYARISGPMGNLFKIQEALKV